MPTRPNDVYTARLEGGPMDSVVFEIADLDEMVFTHETVLYTTEPSPDEYRCVYRHARIEPIADPDKTHEGPRRAVFVFDPDSSTP